MIPSHPGGPPKNVNRLRGEIARVAADRSMTARRVQSLVANVVVAQMLPSAAVKGGTGLKLRFGEKLTRETPDLDAAFRGDRDGFVKDFSERLRTGWNEFSGTCLVRPQRVPPDLLNRVGTSYVMQPIDVKLRFRSQSFATVELELGYDELEATTREPDELELAPEVQALFLAIGLPAPTPVRALPLHHQVAQKIHACSEPGSARAHDLVDLQLIEPHTDPVKAADSCRRLFRFRAAHEWPPVIIAGNRWAERYDEAAQGLNLLSLADAVAWSNAYIDKLSRL